MDNLDHERVKKLDDEMKDMFRRTFPSLENCKDCPAKRYADIMAAKHPLLHGDRRAEADRLAREIRSRTRGGAQDD